MGSSSRRKPPPPAAAPQQQRPRPGGGGGSHLARTAAARRAVNKVVYEDASYCTESSFRSYSIYSSTPGWSAMARTISAHCNLCLPGSSNSPASPPE
ncbi:nucleosome-remodeling factor subunit BPTF-like isoform X2 [Hylobates moloch]|uniref:nucleosome-remodeling factor subunit BPTF-like isoform X2 n=1 Tax=Hylobates moloch TaxID=81572 RepID=UPI002674F47E|nr:nucleosome-remodeling factor subunit BPTF-like isoform X2 [Hylobates moloch]